MHLSYRVFDVCQLDC